MRYAVRWLLSFLFSIQMYLMMAVIGVAFAPLSAVSHRFACFTVQTYCRWVRWTAGWMIGLKSEIRGPVPTGGVLIASKHQSFFDIILIVSVIPKPKFIMKDILRWAPVVGWYAYFLDCIPVKRGRRAEAIKKMLADIRNGTAQAGQLVIYPQGTRVAPRVKLPYKVGAAVLYKETGQPCVPAATNVGLFWPRRGVYRKPGLAVVEFLPTIAPGLNKEDFLTRLENVVETQSEILMQEAESHEVYRKAG